MTISPVLGCEIGALLSGTATWTGQGRAEPTPDPLET